MSNVQQQLLEFCNRPDHHNSVAWRDVMAHARKLGLDPMDPAVYECIKDDGFKLRREGASYTICKP